MLLETGFREKQLKGDGYQHALVVEYARDPAVDGGF